MGIWVYIIRFLRSTSPAIQSITKVGGAGTDAALITGNYNYNMQNFWDKYLGDFETSKHVAPAVVPGKRSHGGKFDWAAAEVMIAWEHYRHYGDLQVLASQYESMLEYMTAGEAILENSLIRNDRYSYGDWCDPVREPGMGRKRCNSQYTAPVKNNLCVICSFSEYNGKDFYLAR